MPDLLIYEDIGEDWFGDGVSAKKVKDQLDNMSGDLTVRINSYGGDVFEGHAIYNLIKHYSGNVKVVIDGIAASAASVIAMAGNEIVMPVNAMMMIHNPYTIALGDSAEMKKTAEVLDQIKGTIVNTYKTQVDLSEDEISDMMNAETWLDADKAESMGFAVKDESQTAVLNKIPSKQWINKAPVIEISEPEPTPAPNFEARKRYLEILAEAS